MIIEQNCFNILAKFVDYKLISFYKINYEDINNIKFYCKTREMKNRVMKNNQQNNKQNKKSKKKC